MIEKYVNEEELKRLISGLLVFLGALTIAALFASIVVPGLRNANRPAAATPVNPVVGVPGWLDPTEFPPERSREIPPVDAGTLIRYSPRLVARGSELFTKNCTQCHGGLGKGDGPAASTLNPRPRDLTNGNGWTRGFDLPSIYKTVTVGVAGTGMQGFEYLSKTYRMALVHYVQALGKFDHGTGTPEALAALEKELSSAGERTPNKIPVSLAIARIAMEFKAVPPLAVDPADTGAGAEVLRRVLADPSRASAALAGSASWRKGPTELAAVVLAGAPGNGFSLRAASLSASEWQALHGALSGRIAPSGEVVPRR